MVRRWRSVQAVRRRESLHNSGRGASDCALPASKSESLAPEQKAVRESKVNFEGSLPDAE